MSEPGFIAVALKWTDLRPDVDPLAGTVRHDSRATGFSLADAAALEWALRLGESWELPVTAITAGPPEAQAVLRDAAAFGPRRLVLVTADRDPPRPPRGVSPSRLRRSKRQAGRAPPRSTPTSTSGPA